ncbi:transcription initiation factor TFIIB [Haloferax larsenii]|uniref:Transcription initiation factor TFIIB n=2 Tax=Haloferax larsenii TaxID=302484 RepID=A0A1H7UTW9_HALLR|nr:transcription initiation factor TFIIB [Haloferax larsenii]
MGTALGAEEETMRDAIRICGEVLRANYAYDSLNSVAGATVYLACTRQNEPISLPDIADVSRKSQKNIQHLGAKLMGELGIQPTPVEPDSYLEDGIEEFEFTAAQADDARTILERGKERNLHSGMAPTTVAGSVLYAVVKKYNLEIRQADVAELVNKTSVSIRNNYRDYLQLADDVTVEALAPQSVEEVFGLIQAKFDNNPAVYVQDAQHLVDNAEHISDAMSPAGIAGGAYLAVVKANGGDGDAKMVADTVGVTAHTIQKHAERFEHV